MALAVKLKNEYEKKIYSLDIHDTSAQDTQMWVDLFDTLVYKVKKKQAKPLGFLILLCYSGSTRDNKLNGSNTEVNCLQSSVGSV